MTVYKAQGRMSRPGRADRRATQARPHRAPMRDVEVLYLPGLRDVVVDEVRERLSGSVRHVRSVPGRDDSIAISVTGSLKPLLRLRAAVAPFLVLSFPVPRPKSLLSGEYLPVITEAVREVIQLNPSSPPTGLRIEAAGRDSMVLRTLAQQLALATKLRHDPDSGECVLRLRRTPERDGWDVLVRLSTLPLSVRPWRVEGYHAAVNATVAAAMVRLSKPTAHDRVANLMCGSGTILVERLLASPAGAALGVDISAEAIASARANASAADIADRVELLTGDVKSDEWLATAPFDCIYADPPWGDKSGEHALNEDLHLLLLEHAYRGAAKDARLVVLTHEIRIMERCLHATRSLWRLDSQTRVFQKGHHPRIYVLTRQDRQTGVPPR